jgi:hypothetical protein
MTISITREDIENGRRCDPDCCPVGRALIRCGVDHLGVVGSGVMIMDERHFTEVVPLPEIVIDWILAFDGKRPVEPISFELRMPAERKAKPRARRTERRNSVRALPEMELAKA